MESQLLGLKTRFEIVKALDARDLGESHLAAYSHESAIESVGRPLALGEIACALSHAALWTRMREEQIDEALILEDDVSLSSDLFGILAARGHFPDDWDLINFRTDAGRVSFGDFIFGRFKLCRFSCHPNGTCAYLLNGRGAQKLLAALHPLRFSADGLTGRTDQTGIISYGIDPQVVELTNFPSDVWSSPHPPGKAPALP